MISKGYVATTPIPPVNKLKLVIVTKSWCFSQCECAKKANWKKGYWKMEKNGVSLSI